MSRKATPETFWARVDRADPSGCWLWTGKQERHGYGRVRWHGRWWLPHRLAWWLTHGDTDATLDVCHTCDVPLCCNPAHLWLGTAKENIADALRKGRMAIGARHPRAKLTWEDVAAIRASSETCRQLGRRYGVNPATIVRVRTGERWQQQGEG